MVIDEGHKYWYNSHTNESTWDDPFQGSHNIIMSCIVERNLQSQKKKRKNQGKEKRQARSLDSFCQQFTCIVGVTKKCK